jgi:hypothetical protein
MCAQKSDHRRTLRVEPKEAKVKFKADSGLFAFLKGTSEEMPVVNVSLRGLRFRSKEMIAPGKILSFSIGIPMLGTEPLKTEGKVVWVERSHRFNGYTVGVKFTSMTQESMSRLKSLISFLGSQVKVKQRVKMIPSEGMKKNPVFWQIARDFDVTLNMVEGVITDQSSWLTMDFEGDRDEIKRLLVYLKEQGATLSFPKKV